MRKTLPTGISNDAMGSVPKHPFFQRVIENLERYSRNWQIPYVTVMYSTGPLFLSVIWKEYLSNVKNEESRVRVLMPEEYSSRPQSFFGVYKGSSWHRNDAKAIFWMGQHWMLVTAACFLFAVALYTAGFFCYRRLSRSSEYGSHKAHNSQSGFWPWSRNGYKILKHEV